ncbi:hypothetical protein PINS_up018440 [Pythium insidiosum]|nr:hypothetical protein PINS_up018440 [Pythium insidiosum]
MCLEFCCGFLCAKALENNDQQRQQQQQRREGTPQLVYVQPVTVTTPNGGESSRPMIYVVRSPNGSLHPVSPSQIPPGARVIAGEQVQVAQPKTM